MEEDGDITEQNLPLKLNELKKTFGSASIIGDDRFVFNIMGNHFRLITRFVFEYKVIQIKWLGTHDEYDKIDALTIQHKK